MIIESGFDLHKLMFVGTSHADEWQVVIVCLDEDLRVLHVKTIAACYAGALDAHGDEIRDEIIEETKYFTVAHRVPDTVPHRDLSHHFDLDSRVVRELEDDGIVFLGHQVHDSEWWQSSGPMHGFESYPDGESMPRVLIVPGPHPMFRCTCVVCGPRNEIIETARRAGEANEELETVRLDG